MIVSLPDCGICLGEVEDGVLCPSCQQGFCKTCLNQSLVLKKECPICRKKIGSIQDACPIGRILERLNIRESARREEIPQSSVFDSLPSVMNENTFNKRIALVYTPGRDTTSNIFVAFGLNFHLLFQEKEDSVGLFLCKESLTIFFKNLMMKCTFAPLGSSEKKTLTYDLGSERNSCGFSKYFSKIELQRMVADNGTLSVNVVLEIKESDKKKMDYFEKNRKEIEKMNSRTFNSLIAPFWSTDLALTAAPNKCVVSKRVALVYTPNEDSEELVNFSKNMMVTCSLNLVEEHRTGIFTHNCGGGSPCGCGIMKYILKSELEEIVCDNGMVGVIVTLEIDGVFARKIEYFVKNRQILESMDTGTYNSLIAPFLS